jgi:hypothetical protein
MLVRKRLLEASLIPGLETGSDLGCKPRVHRQTRDGMLQALMFFDWAEGRHPRLGPERCSHGHLPAAPRTSFVIHSIVWHWPNG